MYEKEKIEEIKKKLDIVDVIKEYLPDLKKNGRNYKTLCPFHSEKTPSFTVNPDKQIFFCFGCQTGGDIFSFVSKIENITFYEAMKKLAQKAGITIEEKDIKKLSALDIEKINIKKVLSFSLSFFSNYLKSSSGKNALDYLKSRNIKDETIRNFSLGLSPFSNDALLETLKKAGFKEDLIIKAGIANVRENGKLTDSFKNRIMFPIKSFNSDILAFGARVIDGPGPKYLNSIETPVFSKRKTLYGLYEALPTIRKFKKILLVEGYMDTITLHQYGINFAVSVLGTSLTNEHAQIIRRFAEEVTLLFDPDQAGINASLKASDILIENGLYPKIVFLPKGKDPDEFVIENGIEKFYETLSKAKDPIEFKIYLTKKNKPKINPEEKSKIINYLLETLTKQKDDIIRNEWIKNISEEFAISQNILLNKLNSSNKREEKIIISKKEEVPNIEKDFIYFLLKEPKLIKKLDSFSSEYLTSKFAKKIYSDLEVLYNNKEDILSEILKINPEYEKDLLSLMVKDLKTNIDSVSTIKETEKIIIKIYYENKWKIMKKNIHNLNSEQLKEFNELSKFIKK